ncbi:MAG: hypothetical protein JNM51_07645 [Bacteroidia bacterium]|nr:hypothetical protein [Bacteroidia bacterium]
MKFKNLFKKSGSKNTATAVAKTDNSKSNNQVDVKPDDKELAAATGKGNKGHVVPNAGNGLA